RRTSPYPQQRTWSPAPMPLSTHQKQGLGGFVAALPVFLAELSYQFLGAGIAHSLGLFRFRLAQVFAELTNTRQLLLASRSIRVTLHWSCAIAIPISTCCCGTHRNDGFPPTTW